MRLASSPPVEWTWCWKPAGAYNLWLTLILQDLGQLARNREGFVNWHLRLTALNNCRYFSVFQDAADAQDLARLMFPITGQVTMGVKTSGDWERLPGTG